MALEDGKSNRQKIVVNIDPDLEELIPGYLNNRLKDVQEAEALLNNGDFESIQRIGHTMKGSGGGYGFDFISAIGLALEENAKEKNMNNIQASLHDLCDFLERVQVVYK
jgi:HPt (histidine-containing phosphotransfer) domain-containing protein